MQPHTIEPTPAFRTITVTSPAFGANGSIPIQYTAEGDDIPPPLAWTPPPRGTKSVAVLVEDPDAPRRIFVHWIVVGIPPSVTELDGDHLPDGAMHGTNDQGEEGYRGPNPPSGSHRYLFRVFALDIELRTPMTKPELMSAIKGHILAQGELVATYQRKHPAHSA